MKLNTLTNKNIPELLAETSRHEEDTEIRRPFGISKEEFTEEYKDHLRKMKKRNPELFDKIMNGL